MNIWQRFASLDPQFKARNHESDPNKWDQMRNQAFQACHALGRKQSREFLADCNLKQQKRQRRAIKIENIEETQSFWTRHYVTSLKQTYDKYDSGEAHRRIRLEKLHKQQFRRLASEKKSQEYYARSDEYMWKQQIHRLIKKQKNERLRAWDRIRFINQCEQLEKEEQQKKAKKARREAFLASARTFKPFQKTYTWVDEFLKRQFRPAEISNQIEENDFSPDFVEPEIPEVSEVLEVSQLTDSLSDNWIFIEKEEWTTWWNFFDVCFLWGLGIFSVIYLLLKIIDLFPYFTYFTYLTIGEHKIRRAIPAQVIAKKNLIPTRNFKIWSKKSNSTKWH